MAPQHVELDDPCPRSVKVFNARRHLADSSKVGAGKKGTRSGLQTMSVFVGPVQCGVICLTPRTVTRYLVGNYGAIVSELGERAARMEM